MAVMPARVSGKYPAICGPAQNDIPPSELELRIARLQQKKASHEKSQKDFIDTIQVRSCSAQTISCILCPLTCVATTIPFILCYPCICCSILHYKRDYCDQALDGIGCVLFQRNLENNRELCCIYCTPLYIDFPEVRESHGFERYTLPNERSDEEARMYRVYQLSKSIDKLKEKQLRRIMRSSYEEQIPYFPSHQEMV